MNPLRKFSGRLFVLFLFSAGVIAAAEMPGKLFRNRVVGLDYYYNHEFLFETGKPGEQFHYTWEDTRSSGFSGLAAIIQGLGARVTKVEQKPEASTLQGLSIYIIVDPDTPKETAHPNYLMPAEIDAIAEWVHNGGVLVLMANDSANCEFEHLNNLAEKFSIHFNKDLNNPVLNNDYAMARFKDLPKHPLFVGVDQIYVKELCSITIRPPAQAILKDGDRTVMAYVPYGKGKVFAIGDPWLYNEYLDGFKLPPEYENTKAANNLFLWLLGLALDPVNAAR
jgi:unsaturated rhamnogalacturonyl hydrolase